MTRVTGSQAEPTLTDVPALRIAPPAFLAEAGLAAVLAALPEARVVGGAVRDTLGGRPIAEIDLATPRTPEDVGNALQKAGLRAVPTGVDHGTVTAVAAGKGFEITTLRRDVETDGRHAVVAFTNDWRADAGRRDFTINAMSMTRTGEIFDYFGGVTDLHAGLVRFVGHPSMRIAEDYLRILRYFRFFAHFGRADPAALTAIRAGAPGLARLSVERIWSELQRILAAPDPSRAVALMAELGVLAVVLPEGADPNRHARLIAAGAPIDPILRLAALLTGDAAALATRLRLSAADRDRLAALQHGPTPHRDDDDAALRRLLADEPAELLIDRAWLADDVAPGSAALRARLGAMPRPVFPLEGGDVLALGEPEGRRVGELLRAVRKWWLDGGCVADKEACRAELLRRM
jgi:poly(A) polymerase/tRNA nucleotidyltransferase (CCA-adding enzyme)